MDVGGWLRGLGLGKYEAAFLDNVIGETVLPHLTVGDLKEIGVATVGDRRTLLAAIAALASPTSSEPIGPQSSPALSIKAPEVSAERRPITVMFCDLVGSTALASRLDPEDLREVIGAYHHCVAETVARFDGFVAKYMGDGVMVYFGYPQAHEDDAERAVRAGLVLVDAVARLPAPERLRVRVGIGTGLVVVGDLIGSGEAQERGVVCEPPNLAARLQTLAEPSTVVIGPQTHRLLGDLFECHDLGEAMRAYRVVRESAIESRFEALHAAATLTPLVGRDEEIEWLLDCWRRVKSTGGQVVLLSGEPGIGKSRLTVALQERLDAEPHIRLRYFCSPHHTDSALHPIIAQLERAARIERWDTPETRLDRLRVLLSPALPPPEDVALFAELLAIPVGDRLPAVDLTPQRKKQMTFAALLRQLETLARHRPVLMIFEDVHWIDPSSLELLDLTIKRVARLPALLLVTFRPEFQPPWAALANITTMLLSPLGQLAGAALVARVAGYKALPAAIVQTIVERTDGVPLFLEELTKTVLESGLLREAAGRYGQCRRWPFRRSC
jgi:class 3 adenylate cyclase